MIQAVFSSYFILGTWKDQTALPSLINILLVSDEIYTQRSLSISMIMMYLLQVKTLYRWKLSTCTKDISHDYSITSLEHTIISVLHPKPVLWRRLARNLNCLSGFLVSYPVCCSARAPLEGRDLGALNLG